MAYKPIPANVKDVYELGRDAVDLINNLGIGATLDYITGNTWNYTYYMSNVTKNHLAKANVMLQLKNDNYSADNQELYISDEGCIYLLLKKASEVWYYTNDTETFPHIPFEINMGDCIDKSIKFQNETSKTTGIDGKYVFKSITGDKTNEIEITQNHTPLL